MDERLKKYVQPRATHCKICGLAIVDTDGGWTHLDGYEACPQGFWTLAPVYATPEEA